MTNPIMVHRDSLLNNKLENDFRLEKSTSKRIYIAVWESLIKYYTGNKMRNFKPIIDILKSTHINIERATDLRKKSMAFNWPHACVSQNHGAFAKIR